MPNVAELYQSLILDHNRSPRNFRVMVDPDRSVEGNNPLCGDELTVWLRMDGDTIADVSWMGKGCAISKASASMMTAAVKGARREAAETLYEDFHDLVTGKLAGEKVQSLGRLAAFAGVARFPIRVKCASLAWHALHAALRVTGPSSAG